MPKPTKSDILKKALVQHMTESLGIVTTACKKAGCVRSTFYDYYNNDPEFKKQIDDIQEIAIDFVESQLFQQIKDGNGAQTIFYLKTKAKHRGYVERQEVTGKDGGAIEINSFERLPEDIQAQILKHMNETGNNPDQ